MALVHPPTYHPATTLDPYALPSSFPSYLSSPLAWTGADLADESYIYHLTHIDLAEIKNALAEFKCTSPIPPLCRPITVPHRPVPPSRPPAAYPKPNGSGGNTGRYTDRHGDTQVDMEIHIY